MSRLAPALFDETLPPPDDAPGQGKQGAPDRVRTMLSAFRSGTERGRRAAEGRIGGDGASTRPADDAGDDPLE